jgi:hypothetical protein
VIPPAPSDPRRLAAVIFDFDGIVLDSETPELEGLVVTSPVG